MAIASRLVAKINNTSGKISTTAPITLKNQVTEIRSIEDIRDVDEVNVANGATLVYNSSNDKYEVRPLQQEDFETLNLDGGSF